MADISDSQIKNQLQKMDPYEFEKLVAAIWESQGYETTVRPGSGDRGVDVVATKDYPFHQKLLIQAKRYKDGNKVGSQDVRNYATLHQQVQDADTVIVVTTSTFTDEAKRLARDLNVKPVDVDYLIQKTAGDGDIIEQFGLGKYGEVNPKLDESSKYEVPDNRGVGKRWKYIESNINRKAHLLFNNNSPAVSLTICWNKNETQRTIQVTRVRSGFIFKKEKIEVRLPSEIPMQRAEDLPGLSKINNNNGTIMGRIDADNERQLSYILTEIIKRLGIDDKDSPIVSFQEEGESL